MHAGDLHLVLLEEVQAVGPILHHHAALLDVLGMVIGGADTVGVGVRELGVHPDLRIAQFVEGRRDRRADAVAGQAVLVAHALEGSVEGVLAHAVADALDAGEQVLLRRFEVLEHVAGDLHRLDGQRDDVRRNVGGALALLAGEHLALLERHDRDDPQSPIQIELIGCGQPQFARADPGQEQQADRQLRLQHAAVLAQHLQELGQFGHAQERIVVDRGQRHRDHVQVGGRVGLHGRDDDHGEVEQLLEPSADLFRYRQRVTLLDAADHFQQMRAGDLVDGQPLQVGKDVLLEDAANLLQRTLPALFEGELPVLHPLFVDRHEGVLAGEFDGLAFLLALGAGVDAPGDQRARLVAQLPGLAQRQLGIAAQGDADAPADPGVAKVPGLGAVGGDEEGKAVEIGDGVRLAGGFGLPDRHVGEHVSNSW